MGIGYVMSVFDDAIRDAKVPGAEKDRICGDLASGVVKLCLDPDVDPHPDSCGRVKSVAIGNHGNGLNFVDAIHSREWGIYLWGENCLRKMNELDNFGFDKLRELVMNEERRRKEIGE
ncbi:MAG: hypothetical protein J0665_14820 [Deltaproteobacteria bacterium]|nr:hypothetical protein [Deltaproteobacteria bacterium]